MKYTINFAVLKRGGIKRLGVKWVKVQAKTAEVCEGCFVMYKAINSFYSKYYNTPQHGPTYFIDKLTNYCNSVQDKRRRTRLLKVRHLIIKGLLGNFNNDSMYDLPMISGFNRIQGHTDNAGIIGVTRYLEFKSGVNPFKMYNNEWFELLNAVFSWDIDSPEPQFHMKLTPALIEFYKLLPPVEPKKLDDTTALELAEQKVAAGKPYKPGNLERRHNTALDINVYRSLNIPEMNFILALQCACDHYSKHNNMDHGIFKYFDKFKDMFSTPKHSFSKYNLQFIDWEAVCLEFNLYNTYIDSVWELLSMESQYKSHPEPELKTTTLIDKWMVNYFNDEERVALYSDVYTKSRNHLSID